MKVTLDLNLRQLKRLNRLLFKGLAYDDRYYNYNTTEADYNIYSIFGTAISEQTRYKQSINGELTK